MTPIEELALLLKPAGAGLYLVSTGLAEQQELQRKLYDAPTNEAVLERFQATLEKVKDARGFILGVPSDVGAGFLRGANQAPLALRTALLTEDPSWPARLANAGIVDIGDVFCVPQLLSDDMLSDAQRARTAKALYPNVSDDLRARLPVSPLSIEERALDLVFALNPAIHPFVIGGDHSTAWPVAAALSRVRKDRWGIVQPDAHTDLLEERLGIRICFATWSFHANELLGRQGRLCQVGTRATRHPKEHWESLLGVKQFWANECRENPSRSLDAILRHLHDAKVSSVYFSNDIDGTDESWADATGTPEKDGLEPDFVVELIRRLGKEIGMLGGDLMELAPALQPRPDSRARTVALAARYLRETMMATLGPL